MRSLTFRGWEENGVGLWEDGFDTQHLSMVRWSGEVGCQPTGVYIVSINQVSPSDPAVVSAMWAKRFSADEKPVPIAEAIDPAGLKRLIEQFRALRGTPADVKIVEQAMEHVS